MHPIIILYAHISEKVQENDNLFKSLQLLPENLRNVILKYQDKQEQAARLGGKLLLFQMLQYFNLSHLSLKHLQKSDNNKPYFPSSDFRFNLSHSGNICICAGTINANIGIDIEQIKPVNIVEFQPYLTEKEQLRLSENHTSIDGFYKIWVKKEAVLKTVGSVLDEQLLNKIETHDEPVIWDNKNIYTKYLYLENGFITCIASDNIINPEKFVVKKVDLYC